MRGLPQKQNARRAYKIRLCGHLRRYKKIVKKTYIIYFNITTDYLLKDEIETIDGADNYSSKNVDMQMLNKELSENDFQNIRYEAEKKKHTSYWLLIIAPFIMILIIFIFYYGFYR